MFSTLLGPLPPVDPTDEGLRGRIRALEETGLDLLAGGDPPAGPATAPAAVVAAWQRVAALTERPVKQALVGPFAANVSDAAGWLAASISALAEAGCAIVEVVEPDLAAIVGDEAARARFGEAHRGLFAALGWGSGEPAVHLSLVAVGGNLDGAGAGTFFELPYPSYAFDLIDGPDNWRLIAAAPTDRGIVCGALAARAAGDETREVLVWAAQYAASTGGRGPDRVGIANAGSLESLAPDVAYRKLRRIAEAARLAGAPPEEAAGQLDPRAFGGRRGRPGARAVSFEPPSER